MPDFIVWKLTKAVSFLFGNIFLSAFQSAKTSLELQLLINLNETATKQTALPLFTKVNESPMSQIEEKYIENLLRIFGKTSSKDKLPFRVLYFFVITTRRFDSYNEQEWNFIYFQGERSIKIQFSIQEQWTIFIYSSITLEDRQSFNRND